MRLLKPAAIELFGLDRRSRNSVLNALKRELRSRGVCQPIPTTP